MSRGALVRKSLENQPEFSQQERLFHEISSFVEEVPVLGTHCLGEEIMKTTSLKDSPKDFFSSCFLTTGSFMAMDFSVPLEVFRFLWDHQAHTGKALVLQLPGCVAPIPWELLPWMDKPPSLSLVLRSHQSSPISDVS